MRVFAHGSGALFIDHADQYFLERRILCPKRWIKIDLK